MVHAVRRVVRRADPSRASEIESAAAATRRPTASVSTTAAARWTTATAPAALPVPSSIGAATDASPGTTSPAETAQPRRRASVTSARSPSASGLPASRANPAPRARPDGVSPDGTRGGSRWSGARCSRSSRPRHHRGRRGTTSSPARWRGWSAPERRRSATARARRGRATRDGPGVTPPRWIASHEMARFECADDAIGDRSVYAVDLRQLVDRRRSGGPGDRFEHGEAAIECLAGRHLFSPIRSFTDYGVRYQNTRPGGELPAAGARYSPWNVTRRGSARCQLKVRSSVTRCCGGRTRRC